jgi:hypothetical protein
MFTVKVRIQRGTSEIADLTEIAVDGDSCSLILEPVGAQSSLMFYDSHGETAMFFAEDLYQED